MKLSIIVSSLLVIAGIAQADGPQVVSTAFSTGYIVSGFDSNDRVQIVAEGMFANTCYKAAGYVKKIDTVNKLIEVTPQAYKYDGMCLQMLVNYNHVIDLGILDAGVYSVRDTKSGELGSLKVKLATSSSADEFMYAPVSDAVLETEGTTQFVKFSGEFTNSCMGLADVRVDVERNTVAVLPITEVQERSDCADGKFPFSRTIELKKNLAKGRYLLHVRALNGNAINKLQDIY